MTGCSSAGAGATGVDGATDVAGAVPSVLSALRSASRKASFEGFELLSGAGGGVCAVTGAEADRASDEASAQKRFESRMSGGDWGIFFHSSNDR